MNVKVNSNTPASGKSSFSNSIGNEPLMQILGPRLLQEARAVSLWSCVAIMCRVALIILVTLAAYRHDSSALRFIPFLRESPSSSPASIFFRFSKEVWTIISVLCGWILGLAPSKVLSQQAPGFIFANPWYVLYVVNTLNIFRCTSFLCNEFHSFLFAIHVSLFNVIL